MSSRGIVPLLGDYNERLYMKNKEVTIVAHVQYINYLRYSQRNEHISPYYWSVLWKMYYFGGLLERPPCHIPTSEQQMYC